MVLNDIPKKEVFMICEYSSDPFAAMCKIASEERWCWNIYCTTCGHMHFRYAFKELINGKHPDQPDWVTTKKNHHQLESLLGPLPSQLNLFDQGKLIVYIAKTSIKQIQQAARFPDWLGYIGLGLYYTENAEEEMGIITKKLVPQFIEILSSTGYYYEIPPVLDRLIKSETERLKWTDLEYLERGLSLCH